MVTNAQIYSLLLTPGSPSKFLMAAFVRFFAQNVIAEICPVQPFVMQLDIFLSCYRSRTDVHY